MASSPVQLFSVPLNVLSPQRSLPPAPIYFEPYEQWVQSVERRLQQVSKFFNQNPAYCLSGSQLARYPQPIVHLPDQMCTEFDTSQNMMVACIEDPNEGNEDDAFDLLVGVLTWNRVALTTRLDVELKFCNGTYSLDPVAGLLGRICLHSDYERSPPGHWILDIQDDNGFWQPEKRVRGGLEQITFALSMLLSEENAMPGPAMLRQFLSRVESLLQYATEHEWTFAYAASCVPPVLVRQ